MAPSTVYEFHPDLPHVESISRILKLPIVEDGTQIAGNVYNKLKRSNSLMSWGLDTAERSFMVATTLATPAINVFNGPISAIDQLLCKGIDVVEEKVPAVQLPPSEMYYSAKDYMTSKIKPVLSRAGSMTQVESIANATAGKLNGALTNVEKHIDNYLPADPANKVDTVDAGPGVKNTTMTIILSDRCIRKLMQVVMNLGKKSKDFVKLVVKNPENALQQFLDTLRKMMFPGDLIKADTAAQSFVLLLNDIRVYGRLRMQEIVDTMLMLPFTACVKMHMLMIRAQDVLLNFKKYWLPIVAFLERTFLYFMRLRNTTAWKIRDILCKWIHRCFEAIVFTIDIFPKGLMNIFHINYEVNSEDGSKIIVISNWLYSKIENMLTIVTRISVGERHAYKQMPGRRHQQNGIE